MNKFKLNKKAQAEDFMQYIPRILFLAIAVLAIILLIRGYIVNNLNVQETQADVLINRIFYSPNSISYYDADLQRTIPGLIDISKMKDELIDKAIEYKDEGLVSAKIELFDLSDNKKSIASAFCNKELFVNLGPVRGEPGAGGAKSIKRKIFVNYIEDKTKEVKQGILSFEVLMPGNL